MKLKLQGSKSMTDIFQFQPKSESTAKQNLNEFVQLSQNKLTAFGKDCWDENLWKTPYGKSSRHVVARFSTNTEPYNSYHYDPMKKPFIDFAKAYVRYVYSLNPVSNLQRHMEALRGIEELLIAVKGRADILEFDGVALNALTNVLSERYSDKSALNKIGYQVEKILSFCRSKQITPSLPEWSNPYTKQKDLTIALDENGKEHRSKKLPSDEEMMLVAQLFHDAPNLGIETEYYTAIMALLMVAPSRGSEPTILPVNCLEWEEDRIGIKKLGIRWNPAKGGKAGLKWVPTVMEEVVVEAVQRLKRIGEPARIAAKFAEEKPRVFMRQSSCIGSTNISEDAALSVEQVNSALSIKLANPLRNKANPKWLMKLLEDNHEELTFKGLGEHEYHKYVSKFNNWPYIDKASKVLVSEALLLHRDNEFHVGFEPRNFSYMLPTVNQINDRFIQKDSRHGRSLWAKHNISSESEKFIAIPSHNARHWLSTKAERGGMDELTLANWAGRAKVSDNKHYDHRTEEEKSDNARELLIPEDATALDKINVNLPVSFEDIGKELIGVAIVTELGVCEHDYAMMPCQRHGDCETCKEMVCIKGYTKSLELLKKREHQVEEQFNKAIENHDSGAFGADRWVSALGWRLSHIKTKIRLLEDENIPDGTPVRIPDEFDPSPIKEILREKGLDLDIKTPESITLGDDVYDLLGML
jgi:hypothetical protein